MCNSVIVFPDKYCELLTTGTNFDCGMAQCLPTSTTTKMVPPVVIGHDEIRTSSGTFTYPWWLLPALLVCCCLVLLSALLPSSHAQKGVAPAVQQHLKGLDPDKANVAKQAMARMGGMGGFRGGGMYGGIHDMFDDEDGFLFNAENKPLHAWTFEDWKDHQETMDSDEYKQMTEHQQREKFDKFHDKHEEKHQKALQAHSFSALFSTFATSRIGSWILLIIGLILFVCIGYCAMFCMKSKAKRFFSKDESGGRSPFRRGAPRTAKID